MRSTDIPEVPIDLDRDAPLSLPLQLARAVRELIDRGALLPGDELPSTRAWAARLGVSRGTVVAAYEQLGAEGYLVGRRGSATRINPRLPQTHPGVLAHPGDLVLPGGRALLPGDLAQPGVRVLPDGRALPGGRAVLHDDLAQPGGRAHPRGSAQAEAPGAVPPSPAPPDSRAREPIDMLPGRPATDWLHTPAWRRAWRAAADAHLGPLPPEGDGRFLHSVAEHMRRMRGLARDPDQYLVTAGGREGLALIITALASESTRAVRIGVESPGYPSLRRTVSRLRGALVPLAVDHAGLRTDRLPRGGDRPDLVIVTPSHQYPLGGSLPVDRRRELLDWARQEEVLVVEDDYDSELRYVGEPLPTLTALDDPREGTVVLLGTFSTTVAPSLGIGMLCAPARLRRRLLETRLDLGTPVSGVVQHAFAEYLASGELRRHTARMRRAYRQRRGLVLEALDDLPGVTVSPMDGGLHAVIRADREEDALLESCDRAGVRVSPGAEYWRGPVVPGGLAPRADRGDEGSIVVGYAHLSDVELREALSRLRSALAGTDRA